MSHPSSALNEAIRAIRGESSLNAVRLALGDRVLAPVIALAPNTHSTVRTIAALSGELPDLLDTRDITDPDVQIALVPFIGTPAGVPILRSWADAAPVGWGRSHATALMSAVKDDRCNADVAAALIGPCDEASSLLLNGEEIASTIRRWGQWTPDTPTAWADALSMAERNRLRKTIQHSPSSVASCLPWLPPDMVHQMPFDTYPIGEAIDAFAAASPIARAQHDMLLQQLVAHARPTHLGALTRLACAIESEAIWQRIVTLVRKTPNAAKRIVTAAPWNTLDRMVHDAILDRADRSTICAAISAARGQRDPAGADATRDTSITFFAALNPDVWNALDPAVQRQWRYALDRPFVSIAVRSLGTRTEFLARAEMNNAIVHAARCHPCDTATLRATLLPVALRNCPLDQAYHLITAMPALPPDPNAFLAIASSNEEPSIIAAGRPMLRHPADLALAVVLQRSADEPPPRACAVMHDALRERTWEDLTPIMSLLDAKTRSAIMPDARTIADRLVRSRRRNDILQAIDRLMSIPPNAALPTLLMMTWWQPQRALEGAEALASTLRTHGDLFMALVDALPDVYRAAALPLPEDVALSHALRESARNDPLTAHHLAHALQRRNRHAVLHALLHLPATNAIDVWHAFGDETRQAIVDEIAEASPEAIKAVVSSPPDLFRAIWNALPPNVQRTLIVLPGFSDLASTLEPSRHPSPNPPLSTMKWRGRRR